MKLIKLYSRSAGFTLVEIMITLGVLGFVSLGANTLISNISRSYELFEAKLSLAKMTQEVRSILRNQADCSASFSGLTFNGQNIQTTPVNVDLWRANIQGTREQIKFSATNNLVNTYDKLRILNLSITMPYYSAGVNFADGFTNFKATLELNVSIRGKSQTIKFPDVILSFLTISGVSTVDSCANYLAGTNGKLPPIELKLFVPTLSDQCQKVDLYSHCGDEDGCQIQFKIYHKTSPNDYVVASTAWLYFEQVSLSTNSDAIGIYGNTRLTAAADIGFRTGVGTRSTLINFWNRAYAFNYNRAACPGSGGVIGPAFSNPYQVNLHVLPAYNAHFTVLD